MCYEEGDGHVSLGAGMEDDAVDNNDTNNSLKRMIADFQTLLSRKNIKKDSVTNVKVHNVQVTAFQSMISSQPLLLQKWVCLLGHLRM